MSATVERWSEDHVVSAAPDAQVVRAARKLADPRPWSDTGTAGTLLWGSCTGSGKNPYRVSIDVAAPAYKCTCPSRKFPCKHSVALLFLWSRGDVAEGTPADFAAEWAAARAGRARRAAAKATTAAHSRTPEQKARTAAGAAARAKRRDKLMSEGLEELDLWLADQLRQGLANGVDRRPRQLTDFAGRMVDAQVPGVAGRLRRIAGEIGSLSGAESIERTVEEFGGLHLLIRAWQRRDSLPEDLAATVRSHLGLTVRADDVLATPGVADTWAHFAAHVAPRPVQRPLGPPPRLRHGFGARVQPRPSGNRGRGHRPLLSRTRPAPRRPPRRRPARRAAD